MLKFFPIRKAIACFLVLTIFFQIVFGIISFCNQKANVWGWTDINQAIANVWDKAFKTPWEKYVGTATVSAETAQVGTGASSAASSAITAGTEVVEKQERWYERLLKIMWTTTKKKMLDMLVNNIVKWIQGGGDPKFVTNWEEFLKDAASEAGGKFIEGEPALDWLCDSFGTEVKIGLGAVPTFKEEVGCTLDDVAENINDFYSDMTKGNGWDGWMKVSQGNNNVFGSYWNVKGEKMSREARAKEAALNEAVSSTGFLGDKVCEKWDCDSVSEEDFSDCMEGGTTKEECTEMMCTCDKWRTRTPGSILADMTGKAVGLDIDWLITADEWNEYIGAILDAAISRVGKEGLSLLTNNDSESKNKQYEQDLYTRLNQIESGSKQFADREMAEANKKNSAINIATRQGQRQLMLEYRKILRNLKTNLKKASDYLASQNEASSAMANCGEFKSEMCLAHSEDFLDDYLNYKMPSQDPELPAGKSLDNLCSEKRNSCIEQCKKQLQDQLVCQQECENSNLECKKYAMSLVSEKLAEKCSDIQIQKEAAEEYEAELDAKEKNREFERVYSGLAAEEIIAKDLLQKLERYKPFDECVSNQCFASLDPENCREQVLYPLSLNEFAKDKCAKQVQKKVSDCIEKQCVFNENSESCEADGEIIKSCQEINGDEYDNCRNAMLSDSYSKQNFNNVSGICFEQKTQIVAGTLEEFNARVDDIITSQCGNNPVAECSSAAYGKITYDPYNKCIRDNFSKCGALAEGQCLNLLTAPQTQCQQNAGQELCGKCYESQFETINFSQLESSDSSNISEEDKKIMEAVKDKKYQEYAQISADIEVKIKKTQKIGEECFNGYKIPDGVYNDYEIADKCIKNIMNTCAPLSIGRNLNKNITGIRRDYTFANPDEWQSFWNGCFGCTSCLQTQCAGKSDCPQCAGWCAEPDKSQCKKWWEEKDFIIPFKIPVSASKNMDIWNVVDWSKKWQSLFNIDGEMGSIKTELEEFLE